MLAVAALLLPLLFGLALYFQRDPQPPATEPACPDTVSVPNRTVIRSPVSPAAPGLTTASGRKTGNFIATATGWAEIAGKLPVRACRRAIARIKEHALVGDAAIVPAAAGRGVTLALLVNSNTPPTYAERLGRQFAYYLTRALADDPVPVPSFRVSVYYPGGTRIRVAVSRHDGEEEVLTR